MYHCLSFGLVANLHAIPITDAVYDVTRRDTFTNLSEIWAKEIDLYSTNQDCIKMLVGNKVDKVSSFKKYALFGYGVFGWIITPG